MNSRGTLIDNFSPEVMILSTTGMLIIVAAIVFIGLILAVFMIKANTSDTVKELIKIREQLERMEYRDHGPTIEMERRMEKDMADEKRRAKELRRQSGNGGFWSLSVPSLSRKKKE